MPARRSAGDRAPGGAVRRRSARGQRHLIGRLFYAASTFICTPNSLSQKGAVGLGAQAGERRLRDVFAEAGFTRFRRATETPSNLILEARK